MVVRWLSVGGDGGPLPAPLAVAPTVYTKCGTAASGIDSATLGANKARERRGRTLVHQEPCVAYQQAADRDACDPGRASRLCRPSRAAKVDDVEHSAPAERRDSLLLEQHRAGREAHGRQNSPD